uniref:PucR family transcriptional regulator n=1 Tax=Rhodococcus qingshengii TaxID=334542 RepID=UPI001C4E15FD|nr:helix-turn-helix domain-containing protein [Rhodococcus qingshengii]
MSNVAWPEPSEGVRPLIRAAAEVMLTDEVSLIAAMAEASSRVLPRDLWDDPVLAHASRQINQMNTLQWITSNVNAPGKRVAPYLDEFSLNSAREAARRGLTKFDLESYRVAQCIAWERWVTACFQVTQNSEDLVELLSTGHMSMMAFVDDVIEAFRVAAVETIDELHSNRARQRLEMATLLISGADVPVERAEGQLGTALRGPHVGLVSWVLSHQDQDQLDASTEAVMRLSRSRTRTTVSPDSSSAWTWLPVGDAPDPVETSTALSHFPAVRVTIGRPGFGADGFRRTHLEALTTQRVLTRLHSPLQVCSFDHVQLVSALAVGTTSLDLFIRDTLGDLEQADPRIQQTALTYVREGFSATRTSVRLFTHRNTVERRLKRADELLPRTLAEHPVEIAAALSVVLLRRPL